MFTTLRYFFRSPSIYNIYGKCSFIDRLLLVVFVCKMSTLICHSKLSNDQISDAGELSFNDIKVDGLRICSLNFWRAKKA